MVWMPVASLKGMASLQEPFVCTGTCAGRKNGPGARTAWGGGVSVPGGAGPGITARAETCGTSSTVAVAAVAPAGMGQGSIEVTVTMLPGAVTVGVTLKRRLPGAPTYAPAAGAGTTLRSSATK